MNEWRNIKIEIHEIVNLIKRKNSKCPLCKIKLQLPPLTGHKTQTTEPTSAMKGHKTMQNDRRGESVDKRCAAEASDYAKGICYCRMFTKRSRLSMDRKVLLLITKISLYIRFISGFCVRHFLRRPLCTNLSPTPAQIYQQPMGVQYCRHLLVLVLLFSAFVFVLFSAVSPRCYFIMCCWQFEHLKLRKSLKTTSQI